MSFSEAEIASFSCSVCTTQVGDIYGVRVLPDLCKALNNDNSWGVNLDRKPKGDSNKRSVNLVQL